MVAHMTRLNQSVVVGVVLYVSALIIDELAYFTGVFFAGELAGVLTWST